MKNLFVEQRPDLEISKITSVEQFDEEYLYSAEFMNLWSEYDNFVFKDFAFDCDGHRRRILKEKLNNGQDNIVRDLIKAIYPDKDVEEVINDLRTNDYYSVYNFAA